MTPNYPPTIYTCYSHYYFNQSKTVCISHSQVFSYIVTNGYEPVCNLVMTIWMSKHTASQCCTEDRVNAPDVNHHHRHNPHTTSGKISSLALQSNRDQPLGK